MILGEVLTVLLSALTVENFSLQAREQDLYE